MTKAEALALLYKMELAYRVDVDYGSDAAQAIDEAIKALEQPEIVRCKDCKWYTKSDPQHPDCDYCLRIICGAIPPDFYCADGERRDDESIKND